MDDHFHADFYGLVIDSEQGLSYAGKPVSLYLAGLGIPPDRSLSTYIVN